MVASLFFACAQSILAAEQKTLPGHLPAVTKSLAAKGDVPSATELRLALGLPVRDPAGLENFLQSVTDPHSANFRQWLTPEEFAARFSPTESDYAALKNFARANGLKITGEHANRLVLDVSGAAANVERALSVKLRRFQHPTESREFFAPDREPVVDKSLPLADVSGLSDFKKPQPKLLHSKKISAHARPRGGSAPSGDFLGNDFRRAYAPDTTLTGAGQIVGLMQFDGFYQSDITAYQNAAGLPPIPVESVFVDSFDGTPGGGNSEVSLDIELAMAMAPGLSKVVCFSAGPNGFPNDILSAMVARTDVKQFSCSWGWSGGPNTTTDNLFRQLAAQGQSFFNASGDSDAFTQPVTSANAVDNPNQQNAPSSSPYITQVGGTYLNTDGTGAWSSESVWSWNDGQTGTGGGISTFYAIPSWQVGTPLARAQGSTLKRNIPDVAMVADFVYSIADNGQGGSTAGTSCSAPLWAGFTALANQQAAAQGKPSLGLINPAIYAIGNGPNYSLSFHDVTDGNNISTASPRAYYATNGFDLCTGWGTPAGQKLIDALVGVADSLQITSDSGFTGFGAKGGAFGPLPQSITVQNNGDIAVTCALLTPAPVTWLKVQPFNGTLAPGAVTNLAVSFTSFTTNLPATTATAVIRFTNYTAHAAQKFNFKFQMFPPISVTPAKGFVANGAVGGPFDVTSQDFTVVNRTMTTNIARVVRFVNWLTVLPTNTLPVNATDTATFTIALNTNANKLGVGVFSTTVNVYNKLSQLVQTIPFTLRIGQNIVSNGGFELGDFRGWTLNASSTYVTNRAGYIHSGLRSALLGNENTTGMLSQTLPTLAGQTYQVSLFVNNPRNALGATPNEFDVLWEGNPLFTTNDLPFTTNWLNLKFNVTATVNGSLLQFGFRDDPFYLGLDDITVKPIPAPVVATVATVAQKLVSRPVNNSFTFHFTFTVAPGHAYQVECCTNLAAPDWTDLGGPINATTSTLDFSDTNTTPAQKFYRLKLVE